MFSSQHFLLFLGIVIVQKEKNSYDNFKEFES